MDSPSTLLKVIQDRRSVRKFDPRPVQRDTLLTCFEAARLAPSADNIQPWRFIVLDDPEIKRDFEEKVFSGIYRITKWATKAPVLIVMCADLHFVAHQVAQVLQTVPYYLLDMGIAGEHFVLRAQELGLGTCWIGWFNVRKAKKILKLPRNVRICELMAVGYPSKDWAPKPKKRKAMEEIVFFNRWGRKA